MKMQTMIARPATLLIALVLALPSLGQPSIDQVPADAALYVGWRGVQDMGPDYEGSNMQGVIEETGLLKALPQLIDSLQAFGEGGDVPPEVAELISTGGTLWSSAWTNGGAMYMLPAEQGGPPIPRLAVMLNKGEDEQQVRASFSKLVGMMNDNQPQDAPPMAFMGSVGEAVFLSIGFDPTQLKFEPLSKSQAYTRAAGQLKGEGALVVYIDVKQWITQVDQFARMMKQQAEQHGAQPEPFVQLWPTLRDASGLSGVNRLMLSAGIHEKNWHTQMVLDAPAPRTGVLALFDNATIQERNLVHVPKSATYLQVFSMDPARVLGITRELMGAVDPGMVEQLNEGLTDASEAVGFDLEKQLIKGMGPVWSVYIDPMIAGNGISSLVFVNELRDEKSVADALAKLADSANAALDEELEDAPIKPRLLTTEVGGTTITHLGVPYVAPAWMVHKGRLYVSLFPQGLEMALEQSGKTQDSILANDAFKKTLDRFDDKGFTGLSFTDLPGTAADGYSINLMIMQTLAGVGEMIDGKPSTLRMPPIGKVMPYIQPAGAVTWVDDIGVHMHSIEPFPGSALLGPAKGFESTMAISGPLAVGIMLPALGSAREAAMQAQNVSQARQLTIAAFSVAVDNKGVLPGDLADLRSYLDQDDEVFFSGQALRNDPLPFNFDQWDKRRQDQHLRKNSSFVLIPAGNIDQLDNPGATILLFQKPAEAGADKLAVGFADGHVETFIDAEALERLLKAQTGKTIEQLIKQQEEAGR